MGVAVSGGADSVGLLRILRELRAELGILLSVVHFNHKLRGNESEEDERFVAQLAREHRLEFHTASADVKAEASTEGTSIEATARELRYGFFQQLIDPEDNKQSRLDKIATGHTLDDQAETVLMRIIRGAGMRGLGGIYPVVDLDDGAEVIGEVIRPLLETRHRELKEYLRQIGQPWREDSSNRDPRFTRNRVRQVLLPLLERDFNPSVSRGLSDLAELARAEEDYWQNEIAGWMGTAIHWTEPDWASPGQQGLVQLRPINEELQERVRQPGPIVMNATVDLLWLLSEPIAVQRRAVKAIGELARLPLEFKHVEEILRFAAEEGPSGKELSLPLGWQIRREPEAVVFVTPDLRRQERIPDYEYPLAVPGRVLVPELGVVIEALLVTPQVAQEAAPEARIAEYNPQELLRADLLPRQLIVRNWRPGDRFWPAHTKSPKKIKELLQERHATQPERRLWPVVASGDEIVWMRGFPVPARLRAEAGQEAVLIRETPWAIEEQGI